MSTTLSEHSVPTQAARIDWSEVTERLAAAYPDYPVSEVVAEIVNAHEAAVYVGTAECDLPDVVEFMATYAMKVRSGEVIPSDRLDPERHATPRRSED